MPVVLDGGHPLDGYGGDVKLVFEGAGRVDNDSCKAFVLGVGWTMRKGQKFVVVRDDGLCAYKDGHVVLRRERAMDEDLEVAGGALGLVGSNNVVDAQVQRVDGWLGHVKGEVEGVGGGQPWHGRE